MRDVELALLPATELASRFRAGELSPVELVEANLVQIERHDRTFNAWVLVDADGAREAARASEDRHRRGEPAGPLDGVTVAVKDVFLTRGWPTLKGSKMVDPGQPWDEDAPAVAALRRAGAVLLGKVTTPELGWKGVTDSPLHGATGNPWDPSRTAGGSSGGSSVAVVLGMAALALGTDGGGSIRIPAGFSGHPGLKPTFGRVPVYPPSPFGTLSHAGPMARTVADCALLLDVLAGPDPRDWTALPPDGVDYRAGLEDGVEGLRVAFSPDLGFVDVDPEVAAAVTAAGAVFEDLGAKVEEVHPGFADPVEPFSVLWYAGAAQAVRGFPEERRALMDPGLAEVVEAGGRLSALDYMDATQRRSELGVRMSRFLDEFDLLLTPTLPMPAFAAGREVPEGSPHRRWTGWTPFTYPFNLTQQPAASVPCGFTGAGMPVGLQIVGGKHRDALVLRAARAYERARPVDRRPPALGA